MTNSEALQLKRRLNEQRLEADIKKYITNPEQFQFGGALNLISTVVKVFNQLAEETGCVDYAHVADKIEAIDADLPYYHDCPSVPL